MAVVAAHGDQLEEGDVPNLRDDRINFRASRESFERIYITELLKTADWNIEKACQNSKMKPEVLLQKMEVLGIHPPENKT